MEATCYLNRPDGSLKARIAVESNERQEIASEAQVMACDYINFRLDREGGQWTACPELPRPNDVRLCMRSMGEEFEQRYRSQFSSMTTALRIDEAVAYPTFHLICEELFRDGVSWGRIVALYAFGGTLAVHFTAKGMEQAVSRVADWVAQYTQMQLSQWILEHGGWHGFVEFYHTENKEWNLGALRVSGIALGVIICFLSACTIYLTQR